MKMCSQSHVTQTPAVAVSKGVQLKSKRARHLRDTRIVHFNRLELIKKV